MSNVILAPATINGRGTMVWTIRAVAAQRPTHRRVAAATASTTGTVATASMTRDTSTA